ncbi:DNA topoisomerase IV, alpha subunit [Hyaloscypha variabilis F]|uniref:DNA topoisomerase (ATP-hydrolyzing) n=1 Tax=Hyaloscypha variabilis (strain UAMH 11265 / GT02V1 / F) TaxID=1149755 RepID=A0A2J6RFC4_HYAVF|nr:DNA topoisomerase IV, alpha subunit [Hyaloscypha variabilis F]
MELDLLYGFIGDHESGTSPQLLSNLHDRRKLTPEQIAEDPALEDGDSNGLNDEAAYPTQRGVVITKIEDIFESIADCILDEGKELVIPLKTRPRNITVANKDDPTKINSSASAESRKITFPSKSPREAWKFTALLRILELSHEALVTGTVTTKRDMYYRDPELFVRQAAVDRYIDDIAYTFGVGRDALNVVAAAKGLVAGAFSIERKDGSKIYHCTEPEGILIPPSIKDIANVRLAYVNWILVIEKEATFRTLATNQYWKDSVAGKGILITAKGYPDIQTRQFLHLLSYQHPTIPIFALVDFDPDGISIMSTYKHGSMSLAHETNVAVPSIRWLGVRSCDFLNTETEIQGLLNLTARDRRVAVKMLAKCVDEEERDVEWKREFRVMLMLNVKAEIQILGNGDMLGEWLDKKLLHAI